MKSCNLCGCLRWASVASQVLIMNRYISLILFGVFLVWAPVQIAYGQQGGGTSAATAPAANVAMQKNALHLNTIGAFSAGFVLQSYGYIGVLADAMSKGVYTPDLVTQMLSETISYLNNVNTQLKKYQSGSLVAPEDLKFIVTIMGIIQQLIAEAEALSAFAQTKSEADLKRFEDSRKKAWTQIKETFRMN